MNLLITEKHTQTYRMNLWLPVGKGGKEGEIGSLGPTMYTALFKMDDQQGPIV